MPSPAPHTSPSWLREYLAEHDDPCPSCGYCLRGLTTDICPECRQHLVLSVKLAEPRLAWFIAGLVAWGGMVGFNGLIGAYFVWEWVRNQRWGPSVSDGLPLLCSLAVGLAAGGYWVAYRKRLGRATATTRWLLAAVAWVIMIASAVWFFANVR